MSINFIKFNEIIVKLSNCHNLNARKKFCEITDAKKRKFRTAYLPNATSFLKFIYSEKATKFCEIFPLLLNTVHSTYSQR